MSKGQATINIKRQARMRGKYWGGGWGIGNDDVDVQTYLC